MNRSLQPIRSCPSQYLAATLFLCLSILGPTAFSREATNESGPIDREQFRQELARLESICNELGLEAEAEISRSWLSSDRSDQHRFYLPSEFPPASDNPKVASWQRHFVAARKRYAAYLFEEAKRLAESGDEARAYRILWQILHEDSEHAQTLRILGPLSTAVSARPRRRGGSGSEGVDLGPSQRWQTRHFDVRSRADTRVTQELAVQLEQFYAIWPQVFFELWAPQGRLKARWSGSNAAWPEPQRMQVVLLADRDEYLKVLGVREPNIAVSIGYYSPQTKSSYFYWTDDSLETVFHELTHQLLAEASLLRSTGPLDQVPGAWCIEGIATYMESLQPARGGWTLGGIESPRLQTARYRALRDHAWPEWNAFVQASIAQWQAGSDIAPLYSHAAGLTHAFLDLHANRPAAREAYFRCLAGAYSGQASADELLALLGTDETQAQGRFRELMTVHDQQLRDLVATNPGTTGLVLSRSRLENWNLLGQLKKLKWLDVSFSNISSEQTEWLPDLTELERLSIEGTSLDGTILPLIARLENLVELDLSQCEMDDEALMAFENHPSLEILWLSGTNVTDKSLELLKTMPSLKKCDLPAFQ